MTVGEAIETFQLPALEPDGALLTVGGVTPAGRAAEIVQEAHAEARRIAAEAEAQGREAGFAAGVEAAREEIATARQALEAAAREVEASRDAALERIELRRVAERDRLVVEVNPDDFELVRTEIESVAASLGGFHGLEVVAERRVVRGGCLLRTID